MKQNNKIKYKMLKCKKLLLLLPLLLFWCGCGDKNRSSETETSDTTTTVMAETMDSGIIELFCDLSYKFVMDSIFSMYQQRYDKVELKINYVNARNATAQLLSGSTRVSIVGRDFLNDEDSLMKFYNVRDFYQMNIANDGLVFFTQADFPIDTLNTEILYNVFTQKKNVRNYLLDLNFEPLFVISEQNSSEYGNFVNLVCKQEKVTNKMLLLADTDSVLEYVKNNKNAIGICYLSQVQGQFYKLLRIGYNDKNGKYVPATKVPHQSYIVMDEYPYITVLRLYLLEDKKNLPF